MPPSPRKEKLIEIASSFERAAQQIDERRQTSLSRLAIGSPAEVLDRAGTGKPS